MTRKSQQDLTSIRLFSSIGVAGLVLPVVLILAGCNKQPPNNAASNPAAVQPSGAAGTPASSSAAAPPPPAVSVAPPSPAPAAPRASAAPPAARAPQPAPKSYTVPAGTRISVRLSQAVSAKQSNVGDAFRGVLAQTVRVGGVPVFPSGIPVEGTVIGAKGQGRFKGAGNLAVGITRIGSQEVSTTAYEKVASGKGKRTAGFIGGGGGGGALIGGLAGGGKGALIGGLLGAGAGTAGAALTGNKDVVIPAESVISVALQSAVNVIPERAAPAQ
ncbi:MAG TPA: hypothetical protein VGR96_11435 [Acidobacteriaceae bacterium]|nr:hypothetical protein [Acidobacteriaceae bacterium]